MRPPDREAAKLLLEALEGWPYWIGLAIGRTEKRDELDQKLLDRYSDWRDGVLTWLKNEGHPDIEPAASMGSANG